MKTKLILETGCNHNGDEETAGIMIRKAAELGAWGVKFQKRDIDSFPKELKTLPRSISNSFGLNYYEHRKFLEFNPSVLFKMKKLIESLEMEFVCTAFDEKSINDLVDIECKYIKFPSQLYSNEKMKLKLLQAKKENNFRAWVSTGMHDAKEIFNNSWISDADVIFHCMSIYPARTTEINLSVLMRLSGLRQGIGYSSHENEGMAIKYAVLAGAEYVERHFTLDHSMKGSDHDTVSSTPTEIKKIIADIDYIESIIGDKNRISNFREEKVKGIYRNE